MAWQKSSPELVRAFGEALPDDPRVERRQMFGYPAAFVGGNMVAGLHEQRFVVRPGEADRVKLRTLAGASVFEPMKGKAMVEYTVVPAKLHDDIAGLRRWVARAVAYGASLPAKVKKSAKKAAKSPKAKPS